MVGAKIKEGLRFFALPAVVELTGLTADELRKLTLEGNFPRPIPVMGGGKFVWDGKDVLAWKAKQLQFIRSLSPKEIENAFAEPADPSRVGKCKPTGTRGQ